MPTESTAIRHPSDFIDIVFCQLDTFRNKFAAAVIYRAEAFFRIEILADDISIINVAAVFVLQFNQAAFAAVGTDVFPFGFAVIF